MNRTMFYALVSFLGPVTAYLLAATVGGIPAIALAVAGVPVSAAVFLLCRRDGGRTRTQAGLAMLRVLSGAVWASLAAMMGITPLALLVLAVLVATCTIISMALPGPGEATVIGIGDGLPPGRTKMEEDIQSLLRRLTKTNIDVIAIHQWENPDDGMDVHVALPEGLEPRDLAALCGKIQASPTLRLPQGCAVTVYDDDFQCEATLRIMLRDCLGDYIPLAETTDPASINDEFPLMRSPQGNWFTVSLRIFCMIIGGTTGSGKTTLMNRIIAYLARCTDALIWVIDFNGGGLGAAWNRPYEEGRASKPIIDWLGDTDAESAAIMACAKAIAKGRKTDREAVMMRQRAGTNVLPVSDAKPALVVITDEGGEVRQAASVLGQIVCSQISSLAQIGRETGVRVIMSVLRGTADLLDKALRAVCSIRVCLRMDEETEYDHVLGRNPGRVRLMHTGSAWVYRTTRDYRPVIGRSVDVSPSFVEAHAVACASLRPDLDEAGQRLCANVKLTDVFCGRDPDNYAEVLCHPALVDVVAGTVYTRRHARRAERLAAIERGDDPDTPPSSQTRPSDATTPPRGGSATANLLDQVRRLGGSTQRADTAQRTANADSDVVFGALTSARHFMRTGHNPVDQTELCQRPNTSAESAIVPDSPLTTAREHVSLVLSDVYPNGLRAGEIEAKLIERDTRCSRGRLYEVLKSMLANGDIEKRESRYYHKTLV